MTEPASPKRHPYPDATHDVRRDGAPLRPSLTHVPPDVQAARLLISAAKAIADDPRREVRWLSKCCLRGVRADARGGDFKGEGFLLLPPPTKYTKRRGASRWWKVERLLLRRQHLQNLWRSTYGHLALCPAAKQIADDGWAYARAGWPRDKDKSDGYLAELGEPVATFARLHRLLGKGWPLGRREGRGEHGGWGTIAADLEPFRREYVVIEI